MSLSLCLSIVCLGGRHTSDVSGNSEGSLFAGAVKMIYNWIFIYSRVFIASARKNSGHEQMFSTDYFRCSIPPSSILYQVHSVFHLWYLHTTTQQPSLVTKRVTRNHSKSPRTFHARGVYSCLLYTSPSPRDGLLSRMPSSA